MGSHWAIAIGINQYKHFQPLMYAQRDAQMLQQFLRTEAGFPEHQCLLFSDLSPSVEPDSISPTRDNILNILSQLCQKLQPDDLLLLFFCGYGVRFNDKDYLMTVESDPTQMPHTGIEVEFLLTKLKTAATRQIVLVLDMGRSQSTLEGTVVGAQTLQLAQQKAIATCLSCQPQQFSHETLALRQGLYTAGLLEALRYGGCVTLDQLTAYLTQRLPQLSEHYWRPTQDPVAFIPPEMRHTLLIPGQGDRPGLPPQPVPAAAAPTGMALTQREPIVQTSTSGAVPRQTGGIAEPESDAHEFWRRLLSWGIPLALVLCAGVLINHRDELFSPTLSSPSTLQPAPSAEIDAAPTAQPAVSTLPGASALPPTLQGVQTALGRNQFADALTALEQMPSDQREDGTYQTLLSQAAEGLLGQARAATSPSTGDSPASAFNRAIQMARHLQPEYPVYAEAQDDIRKWSQGILDVALNRANQPNQGNLARAAQNLGSGILAAQLVPPDQQEIYAIAQDNIATWSRDILALANEHARSDNRAAAIATAQLIPTGTPNYEAAQKAIASWQTQLGN